MTKLMDTIPTLGEFETKMIYGNSYKRPPGDRERLNDLYFQYLDIVSLTEMNVYFDYDTIMTANAETIELKERQARATRRKKHNPGHSTMRRMTC
jgi:hypothetical protein